jgi:hypothetical protein
LANYHPAGDAVEINVALKPLRGLSLQRLNCIGADVSSDVAKQVARPREMADKGCILDFERTDVKLVRSIIIPQSVYICVVFTYSTIMVRDQRQEVT